MPEACKPAYRVVNKETLSQTRCKVRTRNQNFAQTHSFGVLPHRHTYEHRHIYTYTRVSLRVVMITIIYFIWNRIQGVFLNCYKDKSLPLHPGNLFPLYF